MMDDIIYLPERGLSPSRLGVYFLIDLTAIIALVRLIIAVVMSIRIFNVSIISDLLSFSMSILYTYIIYMSRPILKNP